MEETVRRSGLGARIRAVRKARGITSTAELAALIPGDLMSGAVLRNIEAGVKTDVSVSQLLNIARALTVSPIFLLVPIREPDSTLDLPNLSDDLKQMTAIEFDDWLSGGSDSIHEWTTADDHSERNQLRAMRELERQAKERDRLALLIELAPGLESLDEGDSSGTVDALLLRKTEALRQIDRLSKFLNSAGWNVQRWSERH
jgi:transcriptional regulator with XRE-family HTH domain